MVRLFQEEASIVALMEKGDLKETKGLCSILEKCDTDHDFALTLAAEAGYATAEQLVAGIIAGIERINEAEYRRKRAAERKRLRF